jgi:nicotinamidase-related amidase
MSILEAFSIDREKAVLLVIDVQEKLCGVMDPAILAELTRNLTILLEMAKELGIPTITTEQYTRGLGEIIPEIREKLPSPAIEKMCFSCCGDKDFTNSLKSLRRSHVIVAGMETHICVLQTVLDLLAEGFHVHVAGDAVMSRKKKNWKTGLNMAEAAGAVITSTETVLFQLLRVAGTDEFKKLSKLVR